MIDPKKHPWFFFLFTILSLFALLHSNNPGWASVNTNGYKVVRGERPPISFNTKDSTSWQQNVLIIKFERDLEQHLKNNPPYTSKEGITTFGITAIDSLNARYGVGSAKQYFLSPALHNTFTDRHKAWGFHLWYLLETTSKTDILQMMNTYAKLPEIEITTPSFIKILHHQDNQPPYGNHKPSATPLTNQETSAEALDAGNEIPLLSATSPSHSETTIDRSGDWMPDDPLYWSQWAFRNTGQFNGRPGSDVSLPKAHAIEKGDTTVIVAVVDGGIDLTHEDIAGNIWYQTGYNFVHNSPVIEPHNHGTLVAGIIGATNNNSTGVAGVAGGSGSNDGVRLMTAQVFAQSGTGGFHLAQVYAADNGAAISQNSWGYSEPGYYNPAILDAFDYFNAHGGGNVMEGGIVFSSAGNSNDNGAYYPGYYSGVFSVTGTSNRDEKAWYSNYGSYIDLAAPGGETNVVTQRGVHTTHNNDSYGYSQGTSVACPFASGAAALLLSYAYRHNHILANSEVKAFLKENTDDINPYNPNYHNLLGSGRLNAHKVLLAAQHTLGNIANPGHFASKVSPDDYEVSLSWTRNPALNEVMIAWSADGTFGRPENGIPYQAGDHIAGGGQVLFRGSDTLFIHKELEEYATYHYKAFSYDGYYEYSHGRAASATTAGAKLVVTGLNKGYSSIPAAQLPIDMQLKAQVQNNGLGLNRESSVHFTVTPSGFTSSASIPLPLNGGQQAEVIADEPWHTTGIMPGSYQFRWEAEHSGSDAQDKTDHFTLQVTDSLYARDSGNMSGGLGNTSGPMTFGLVYEIHQVTSLNGIQIQWPDNPLSDLDFRIALYEVNGEMEIISTAFMSEMLTRTPEMQNTVHNFMLDHQAVVIEPGTYMLAVKQLTADNLMVGFDAEPLGSFHRADRATDPLSFPHQHFGYGHLALRLILTQADNTSAPGNTTDDDDIPGIWVFNNILYVDNPLNVIQVTVLDINGRCLQNFEVQQGINSFPLQLPAGIYFIITDSRNSTRPKKVIIH